jgi:hypothetical protein
MVKVQNCRQMNNESYCKAQKTQPVREAAKLPGNKQQAFPDDIHLTQKQLVALVGRSSPSCWSDMRSGTTWMHYEQKLYGDRVSTLLRHRVLSCSSSPKHRAP